MTNQSKDIEWRGLIESQLKARNRIILNESDLKIKETAEAGEP
jgi:hypothetical protein